ncbi:uncharacterized protein LOC120433173 [Oreochromis aureus]|uniref:uncharacterized protein LOC120433173 n=1 Tax=Oreochromis aureus TaxID=47969 RepID=UPI0019537DA6|nr:uncharacterized protein LOC120433173 [Oreochromis aureus]
MPNKKDKTENVDKRPLKSNLQLRSQVSPEANPEANDGNMAEANPSFPIDYDILTAKITDVVGAIVEGKMDVINNKLDVVQATLDGNTRRLDEAETRISKVEDIIADMETRLTRVESKICTFTNRLDDQEARSRRDNLRIFGVKEGVEGANAIAYFEKWLPSLLNMKTKNGRIRLDRCHRSLGEPISGSPRAVIMKLHYPTDKREVLALSGKNKQIFFDGALITIRQDVPQNVRQQRRNFNEACQLLITKGIRFRMLFPATLRFTYENRRFSFDSAEEALKVVSAIGALPPGYTAMTSDVVRTEKCSRMATKRGKVVRTEGIKLPEGNIADTEDSYKYLGIPQANGKCK